MPSLNLPLHATAFDAAIVDLDGTLVHTLGDFSAALDGMLGDMGLAALPQAVVERHIGKGSEHLVRQILAEAGAAPERFDDALALYQRHYGQINGRHSEVYPGVVQGLQRLQAAGWRLACLTNKPAEYARQLLQAKGLAGFFPVVYGGDSFARKKPDPLPVQKSCEALRSTPARTLVIGDSGNDVQAARAAGCPVVMVSYGYNHGQPAQSAGADAVLDSLVELLPGG